MSLVYTGGPNHDGFVLGWPARNLTDAELAELGLAADELVASGLYQAMPPTKADAIKAAAPAPAPEPAPQPDASEAGPAPAETTQGGTA